jgi:hypothetical protein
MGRRRSAAGAAIAEIPVIAGNPPIGVAGTAAVEADDARCHQLVGTGFGYRRGIDDDGQAVFRLTGGGAGIVDHGQLHPIDAGLGIGIDHTRTLALRPVAEFPALFD